MSNLYFEKEIKELGNKIVTIVGQTMFIDDVDSFMVGQGFLTELDDPEFIPEFKESVGETVCMSYQLLDEDEEDVEFYCSIEMEVIEVGEDDNDVQVKIIKIEVYR